MDEMWNMIEAANQTARSSGEPQWLYTGDRDIREGGTATRVDRKGGYATVIDCTDLASAVGQEGCAMIEANTVSIPTGLRGRQQIRVALAVSGYTMAGLRADYGGESDWMRWALIAESLYRYGYRDTPTTTVYRHEPAEIDANGDEIGSGPFEVDCTVEGAQGLALAFMGNVY